MSQHVEVVSLGGTLVDVIVSVSRYPEPGGDTEVSAVEMLAGGSAANFGRPYEVTLDYFRRQGRDRTGNRWRPTRTRFTTKTSRST